MRIVKQTMKESTSEIPTEIEPVVKEQNIEAGTSDILVEITTEQQPLVASVEAPSSSHSNMSYADFERFQTPKIDFLKNLFRDMNKAT